MIRPLFGLVLSACLAMPARADTLPALPPSPAAPMPMGLHIQDVWQRVDAANAEVQSAQRGLEAAQADQTTAHVTPPTQFSLLSQGIDTRHLGGSVWHKPIDTIARLDHTLERGDKLERRDALAQAGVQASRADLQDARRTQRIAASQAYWDLKLAQEQMMTRVRHAQLAMESSRLASLRLQQGDLSRLEATRLAVEAERAQNDVSSARLNIQQAQQALAQLLRWQDRAITLRADDPWPEVPASAATSSSTSTSATGTATTEPEAWLNQRPDVQAAQARLDQAEQALSLADAQRVTDVTVSMQFEHNPTTADRLWGVGIAFPLGVDGRQDGPLKKAMLARDEAQAQLEQVRQRASAEHSLQQATMESASQRIRGLDQQMLPQAREALAAAEYARQQGALGLQDVLDARRALHAAELDSATAHADLAKAWSTLHIPASDTD